MKKVEKRYPMSSVFKRSVVVKQSVNGNRLSYWLRPLMVGCTLLSPMTTVSAATAYGLSDVYQMAASHDATLTQAHAQFLADEERLGQARAALLPSLQADASVFQIDSNQNNQDVNTQDVSLTLNQSLYKHELWAGYDLVKHSVDLARYRYQDAQQALILRVTQAYFNALLAQKTLQLLVAKEKADKNQLDRAEASAEVGLASRVDVLQAKSSYDLSKSERINAQNNVDIQLDGLTQLIGQPIRHLKSFSVDTALFAATVVEQDATTLEQLAMSRNLQIKQVQTQVESARSDIDVKKGGFWPSVNLQAKMSDTQYSNFQAGASYQDSQKTSVGVTVSLPLFSGGDSLSKVAAARHSLTASQAALRAQQEAVQLEVRSKVRNLQRGESLIMALEEAVKSNDAFVEAAEEGYKVGLKSMLEVLSARSNQMAARKNLAEARHNHVLNKLRLEAAIGDLTADDLQAFEPLLNVTEVLAFQP